jgi:hypothetical protein
MLTVTEMIVNSLIQSLIGSFGGWVLLAAALVFVWKLLKDARKPALVLLALAAFTAWWFWPVKNPVQAVPRVPSVAAIPPPPAASVAPPRYVPPAGRSNPVATWEGRPAVRNPPTYAEKHAPALKVLEERRKEKMRLNPSYYTPEAREERMKGWLIKEFDRQRKAEVAANEERQRIEGERIAATPPQIITPDQARELQLQTVERHARGAPPDLRQMRGQTPTMIGGGDTRTYR